jgi:hypothetical protein
VAAETANERLSAQLVVFTYEAGLVRPAEPPSTMRRKSAGVYLTLRPVLHLPGMFEDVPGDSAGRVARGPAVWHHG